MKYFVSIGLILGVAVGCMNMHKSTADPSTVSDHLQDDRARVKALFYVIRSQSQARAKCETALKIILDMDSRRPASRAELFLGSPSWHFYLSMWLSGYKSVCIGSSDPERDAIQWSFLDPWEQRFYLGEPLPVSKPGGRLKAYLRELGYLQGDGSNYPRRKKIQDGDKLKILNYAMRLWDEAASASTPGAPLKELLNPI